MNIISIHNLAKPSIFILHWKIDKIGKLYSCTTGLRTEAKFSIFKVEPVRGNLRHHRFSLNRLPSPTRQRSSLQFMQSVHLQICLCKVVRFRMASPLCSEPWRATTSTQDTLRDHFHEWIGSLTNSLLFYEARSVEKH